MNNSDLLAGIGVLKHPRFGDMDTQQRLLHACLCAYAKHHLKTEEIGWEELGDILHNAICEAVGDDNYCKWLEKMDENPNASDFEGYGGV